MILAKLIPAALANHLWQSTLFAAAAALLALALRKNRAQTRYTLWLIASLKFLVPFALLIAAGAHLRWPAAAPIATPTFSVAVQQIGQPFTAREISTSVLMPAVSNAWNPVITILFSIWFVGFAAVLLSWWRRWMRVRAIMRAASPRPFQAPVPVLSSPTLLEPGVFGIFRPVLLLPEGITGHLSARHLESIFAHELCHVRRRDNLAAAIHMFVEALFWFHPLVWWIGARMMEERERACDEEVLRLGNQPQVYAESILKACQFYLESPLACISGVTGSDLKKRIVRIMTPRMAVGLDLHKKLLLAAAAMAALAVPLSIGLMNAAEGRAQSSPTANTASFEVASIKPAKSSGPGMFTRIQPGGSFRAHKITIGTLIQDAYGLQGFQIVGLPSWADSKSYDITAKAEDPQNTPVSQRKALLEARLQSLLTDRFKLTVHESTKRSPVYQLIVNKHGPKITPSNDAKDEWMSLYNGVLTAQSLSVALLAENLSSQVDRTVEDRTGLTGKYDFTLRWDPDQMHHTSAATQFNDSIGNENAEGRPSLFTAVQEQLGLKLQPSNGPVKVLIVDRVELPSTN